MQANSKSKFTKEYVNCILNNQNLMYNNSGQFRQPIKSCQFSLNSRKSNLNLQINNSKVTFMSSMKGAKIFDSGWKQPSPEMMMKNNEEEEKQIQFFMKKNQEIANSLMKDKKSMSDIVYKANVSAKMNKYKNFIIDQKVSLPTLSHHQSDRYQLNYILPSINNSKKTKVQVNQTQIVAVLDKNIKKKQQQEVIVLQNLPTYEDVTNINIKKFLKLKQQAYKSDHDLIKEQQKGKNYNNTKKLQKQRQKMARKQKQKLRNSLQEYLQTNIISKVKRSPQGSLKNSLKSQRDQKQSKNDSKDKQKEKQDDGNNRQQTSDLLKKINQRSLVKKNKINIGKKTKFSSKNIFLNDPEITIYEGKVKSFREFLFLINFTHGILNPLVITDQPIKNQSKYKYYVGRGNNRQLIRTLLKRRFWWVQTDNPTQANFIWTQLKINQLYNLQQSVKKIEYSQTKQNTYITDCKSPTKKSYLYKAPFPSQPLQKILSNLEIKCYKKFQSISDSFGNQQKFNNFQNRLKYFSNLTLSDDSHTHKVHNHLQHNFLIGNKKALFYNLKEFYETQGKNVYDIIPLTFHIEGKNSNDPIYRQFLRNFKQNQLKKNNKNVWIVKPGENSNRGNGITVFDQLYELNRIMNTKNKNKNNQVKTFIIQKYIEKPLLYKGRKFDIRHYMLATKMFGKMRLYWYGEGYVRTSSYDYSLEEVSEIEVHLTNDAIQKEGQNYGKYEQGNKISYTDLQRHFDVTYPNRKYSIVDEFYPKAKSIALDAFKASYLKMDPRNLNHNFQVFGLDYMIDANFNVWLIQVNTNPCLELNAALLNRIIPNMVENTFRLTIDPLFPPPCHYPNSLKHLIPDNALQRLQYQLIFDQERDGKQIQELVGGHCLNKNLQNLQQDQDTYDNDGKQVQISLQ